MHLFSRFWGIYWDRGNYVPHVGKILLVEMFIRTCWKGIIPKNPCRVIQKLSVHILYKLKVQKCPEIAAKNNLIVCLLHIVKNSKTIKQHFQFLSWKLISRRFCIEREKLDYTLQITYCRLHASYYTGLHIST